MCSELFTATDADVVLRTSDNVQFRVYHHILSEASPFFKDLFSLPQGDLADSTVAPIVDVSESAEVMEGILRLIYPKQDPVINSLDELSPLLAAATKYDIVRATETLRRLLVSPRFVEKEPTRVYAIACRHDLEAEARVASKHTLRINILDCPLSDDLKHITAWSYHRLLDLHRQRSKAAQAVLDEAITSADDVKCMQCSSSHYGSLCPPRWWTEFATRAKEELRVRPTSDVIFTVAFLVESSRTGCQRCAGSILESHAFLERVKSRINELPSTI
ncbi:hypothetical protein EW145_g4597 [Phellinidium pouzarii]|uniref:BTB domain-containing protein n=1 Tax=Phellinidium pouzarii TaxID=167371 RepID=A0A4S4L333_9AGAM|nr:hypothetical protein EW145_g4597 [Phellinidium pouzarii]